MRYFVLVPGKVFTDVLDIAREQHGYVRAADLRQLGLNPKRLNDYWRRGQADRLGRGLYRLRLVPPGEWDEFMEAAMWPDGRGVLGHETALDLHDLCDVNPGQIDVTVPNAYRTHRQVPARLRLHHRNLAAGEVTVLNAVPIVTPARAIEDAIEIGLRPTLIEQALETALSQALITTATAERLEALRHAS